MFDCFLSYQHEDIGFVKKLVAELEKRGLTCWYAPRDVVGNYPKAIDDGIRQSQMFLLILNARSAVSEAVLNEVEIAHNVAKTSGNAYMQPVSTQALDLNDPQYAEVMYYIRRRHFIDAGDPPDYVATADAIIHALAAAKQRAAIAGTTAVPPSVTPPAETAPKLSKKTLIAILAAAMAVMVAIALLLAIPAMTNGGNDGETGGDSRPSTSTTTTAPDSVPVGGDVTDSTSQAIDTTTQFGDTTTHTNAVDTTTVIHDDTVGTTVGKPTTVGTTATAKPTTTTKKPSTTTDKKTTTTTTAGKNTTSPTEIALYNEAFYKGVFVSVTQVKTLW